MILDGCRVQYGRRSGAIACSAGTRRNASDAWLVVDDARGFRRARRPARAVASGIACGASQRLVYMGTLGKAAGASGAFVAAHEAVIECLLQNARSYIFTTGSSPVMACALLASLKLIENGNARREHLRRLTAQLRDGVTDTRWKLLPRRRRSSR
ncbi:aminotransferase class I/II-fold pyridoxal phosphate-dependent enzyme [Propionivibrio sp.]|uniref:aminotransferase class I/II-fold pyridoxal phosphate-dependent enzyme n=1 Tax=Propionivibrio sp. TaxID=2212460 RepID=UPI0025EE31A9|nr:aminotransferase class I/II-fold pyridoxal phosphate-dependent enzyme [Propionivibrio sp.]